MGLLRGLKTLEVDIVRTFITAQSVPRNQVISPAGDVGHPVLKINEASKKEVFYVVKKEDKVSLHRQSTCVNAVWLGCLRLHLLPDGRNAFLNV